MRFASLGSGSGGNALLVEAGGTRLMIDCGFGLRDTVRRLQRLNVEPEMIDAVFITHEHTDHVGGVVTFAGKFRTPVWMSYGTYTALNGKLDKLEHLNTFDSHATLDLGDLQVQALPVPHDAREPVQFIVSDGVHRLAMLTDIGASTTHIEAQISGCDALVLECNHDLDLLYNNSSYPYPLKQRISSRLGHLHNEAAAELLAAIDCSFLKHVIAAHLSQHNNHPDKVRTALAQVLGCAPDWIGVADQDEGFGWRGL
ncbi:MAG: MBL fold metallo-hydrolase [Burkholderiales bacterium]|jgi:phosphoribosyl 1,2-cyclic phosphodiesterase|nr:MBL fold metallo-hydrolase [Burkholderiales bacterium]